MKKFFSFIAMMLFAGSMMAEVVTFTKEDFAGQGTANSGSEVTATKNGVTFTFSKGYCADESLRCYAHGALSITASSNIQKINFTTTGGKTGGLDAEVTVNATSYTVADLASQARFTEIAVTLGGEGGGVEPGGNDTIPSDTIVTPPVLPSEGAVTFTKEDFAGQGTANTGSEVSATKNGVTFTFSKGYCADESLRCYAHGALSITASSNIQKINFTTTGGKTGGLDAEVTVNATSYTVADLASQARFTEIAVTLGGEGGGVEPGGNDTIPSDTIVTPPVLPSEGAVTFTKEDFAGQGTANTGSEVSATKNGVTFTFSKGYCADESLRCYAHGALSITASSNIQKINFTTTGGKTGGLDAEVIVNATSYTVADLASQARFTEIVVTLGSGEAPAVATPVISGEESFEQSTEITITCATEETQIYYTLDGSDPRLEGAESYAAPFTLSETATVKAAAYDGTEWSDVAEMTFTKIEPLGDPTTCAEAREAALSVSANNELYNNGAEYTIEGYVTSIATAYSSQYNNITFWMADAANGGNVLEAFRAVCASADDAPIVGDKVAVTGSLTKYNSTPEFAAGCTFTILEHATPVEPQNLGEKTIAEFLALANTVDTCILTGIVDSIANTTYGNLFLTDATATVYVYGVLTAEGANKQFASLDVEVGDQLTILAIYNVYNNAPQVKNAIFVSRVKAADLHTAIDNTAVETKAVKLIENGKLIIIKNGVRYDAQGALVR